MSSRPFCTKPQTEEAPSQHFPEMNGISLPSASCLQGHNSTIWETVITLYIREVSRSHVPKHPHGPEQQNKRCMPEERGRAVRQWRTVIPAVSPPAPLALPHSTAAPELCHCPWDIAPALEKALQLLRGGPGGPPQSRSMISCKEST